MMSFLFQLLFLAVGLPVLWHCQQDTAFPFPVQTPRYLIHATEYYESKNVASKWLWQLNDSHQHDTTSRMMVFKVLQSVVHYHRPKFDFQLPDQPEKEYSRSDSPWCRIYSKADSNKTKCKSVLNGKDFCEDAIETLATWPPNITTRFDHFSAVMSYDLFDCDAIVPTDVVPNTNTPKKPTIETEIQCDKLNVFEGFSATPTIVFITATVVLAVICLLLIVCLCKTRQNNKRIRNVATIKFEQNQLQNLRASSQRVIEEQEPNPNSHPAMIHHDYASIDVFQRPDNDEYLVPIQHPVPEYQGFDE